MDAKDADRVFRPDFMTFVHNFLAGETEMEREILFCSVEKVIGDMKLDGLCEEIIYFYISNAIQTARSVYNINPANRFSDIVKMLNVLYPDRGQYTRTLAKQTIIMTAKLNMQMAQTNIGEYIDMIKEFYT